MEIKANASLEFIDYLIVKKITFGLNAATCLDLEKESFPNLPFATATLEATSNALSEAEKTAMSGDKIAIEKRNDLNELWDNQFRKTAQYVSFVADGNITLIKSAGFTPTKTTRQKKAKITGINNFKAEVAPAKGTATVACKRPKGANGYVMIVAQESVKINAMGDNDIMIDANGVQVRLKIGTQTNATFTGLQSEVRVNISMLAFNTAGCSPLTDAQSVLPQ